MEPYYNWNHANRRYKVQPQHITSKTLLSVVHPKKTEIICIRYTVS